MCGIPRRRQEIELGLARDQYRERARVHEWASSRIVGRTGSYPERDLWKSEDASGKRRFFKQANTTAFRQWRSLVAGGGFEPLNRPILLPRGEVVS
jgi:hypothetical protein